jgi:hypothetical protein
MRRNSNTRLTSDDYNMSTQQGRKKRRRPVVGCLTVGTSAVIFCFFWNLYTADRRIQDNADWTLPARNRYFELVGAPDLSGHSSSNEMLSVESHQVRADWPQPRKPTNHACSNVDGIYHIAMGDKGGAAGTVFFQFVIGQLIYAERNNLKPWIHFNNVSYVVYDPLVHNQGPGATLTAQVGKNATYVRRPGGHWRDAWPGPLDDSPTRRATLHFDGTGVWEHYFEPASDFVPGDKSCQDKLYATLDLYLITPGIHAFAPWATSCWRYKYLHDYITKPHIPINEWLEPRRVIGHDTLRKYIRFKPYLTEAAQQVNPGCSQKNSCLGMHIRHSDKAAGRRQIETKEFLPFAQAFVHAGGHQIYLATDSALVLQEIENSWPANVKNRLRTMGLDVVRSSNETAVFDKGSHHRTNKEALTEILALSQCQYMIHGFSAMSESSIWINIGLHNRSVNLEDTEHIQPVEFGTLVQMSLRGEPEIYWPHPRRTDSWWSRVETVQKRPIQPAPCHGYDGVLLISSVSHTSSAAAAFFTDVINQLLFATENNLLPWIHLENGTDLIYDPDAHQLSSPDLLIAKTHAASMVDAATKSCPAFKGSKINFQQKMQFHGNGIWESYFEPISVFRPDYPSCSGLPVVSIPEKLISPGLNAVCSYTVKAWRYDDVAVSNWKPDSVPLTTWYGAMRNRGNEVVKRYIRFLPHIVQRAKLINPTDYGSICLGVHIRVGDKSGKYREKVSSAKYIPYLEAFYRAGGRSIYIASDSHRALQYITKSVPVHVSRLIRTQGSNVVRTYKEYPTHFIDAHHRVNSETLVDILALSKCSLLLHSYSTVSEAAIYLNIELHNNSVNLEDADRLTPEQFKGLAQRVLGDPKAESIITPAANFATVAELKRTRMLNASIVHEIGRKCRTNAIVYLAQKMHSTYGRDSYKILLRSVDLLYENYLANMTHMENVDVFIFHAGDFVETDLNEIEKKFGPHGHGAVRLVDISDSPYWARPASNAKDDPNSWYAYPLFKEGYRRMMHWYAIDIWRFFAHWNEMTNCNYRYIFRLDEDSFIHSPIRYDIFELFKAKEYVYGYRMCAYEMKVAQRMWTWWKKQNPGFAPYRELDLHQCGFYNNLFVADLHFFQSDKVQRFLNFIDRQGHIYRRRLGDLMIHTMAVIAYAPPERIHRFLDFTYEHGTLNETDGCLIWGGIQAGYDDPNATATLGQYYQTQLIERGCPCNSTFLPGPDLSPTYAHIPEELREEVSLQTIVAGRVELPAGKGILSG